MKKALSLLLLPVILIVGLFYFFNPETHSNAEPLAVTTSSTELTQEPKGDDSFSETKEPKVTETGPEYSEQSITLIAQTKGVDEELLRWFFSTSLYDDTKEFWASNDEDSKLYRDKMLENPEEFIKLATLGFDNPYIVMVLIDLPEDSQELLLPYLNYPDIADMAYNHELYLHHPNVFAEALYNWDDSQGLPPSSLILPAIKNDDIAMLDVIEKVAVSDDFRHIEIFEALSDSAFKEMIDPIATEAWENYDSLNKGIFNFDHAVVAARYIGNRDAFMECVRLYKSAEPHMKPRLRNLLMPIVSYQVDINELENVAEELVYDASMRWWSYPI